MLTQSSAILLPIITSHSSLLQLSFFPRSSRCFCSILFFFFFFFFIPLILIFIKNFSLPIFFSIRVFFLNIIKVICKQRTLVKLLLFSKSSLELPFNNLPVIENQNHSGCCSKLRKNSFKRKKRFKRIIQVFFFFF